MGEMARSGGYPAEFRGRAAELRSIAALVHNNHKRAIFLKCAADCDEMAVQHEPASAQGDASNDPPQASTCQSQA
jgi:hypothetical protein